MTYLLGLDLGTSGVKALLLPVTGEHDARTYSATAELTLSTPYAGWSEQNPADWWHAVTHAIRGVLETSGVEPREIAGLATSGQMHGATLLDGAGEVVRPCILWNDQRSAPECAEITEQIGLDRLLEWVGNPALAGFTAPKLLWVRRHEPEAWSRTRTVLLPKDYINYRLTGNRTTEMSDASGTLLFDVAQRCWSGKMLESLGLSPQLLPSVHLSTDQVGQVSAQAARETGLRQGTPVAAGGADNACAAMGMGVVRPGELMASLGTSGTVLASTARAEVDPAGRLHTFCHAVADTWYVMGVVLSAGGSLRWFRDTLAQPERQIALSEGRDPYQIMLEACAAVSAGSEGLLFLPYLTGERTPHGDPHARGVFFGLSLRHTRAHLTRSVIEGVAYALADSTDLMRQLGLDIDLIRATGGGARSALWMQILADVLETRVETSLNDTGPSLGAAILAGVGTGVYPSVPAATETLVTMRSTIEPDTQVGLYRGYRTLYQRLYPALKEHFGALASLQEQQWGT
ncbi:MAG: xylulokinase [Chloroflexota bacterium]|nr:xylulokinase [Chloroflexota bacterium]